ncbi:hypothetical protein BB934_45515 (plasmid) [Microvirga ossetica]|uniref:Uncharacterized protein n=1 Tax=Microvirga ossetica TaxID=1882682 RepID=A0A1B2EZS8_9HYPH|nr:hypothetical protein [Microvirga ossetica]ANY85481.1 hypothetical protein BB934_45515 [Microvirga ossetica]
MKNPVSEYYAATARSVIRNGEAPAIASIEGLSFRVAEDDNEVIALYVGDESADVYLAPYAFRDGDELWVRVRICRDGYETMWPEEKDLTLYRGIEQAVAGITADQVADGLERVRRRQEKARRQARG